MGKTTEDIEILLIVSLSGTRKGVFPTINFEKKIFILKFIYKKKKKKKKKKMLLFTPNG